MLHSIMHITEHAFLDSVKLIPFLFITYLAMEWLEHKTGLRTQAAIRRAGRTGPLIGGILGVFPQCGFSAAASNLYAGGLLTAGTLTAVFLSTSDEMLPIFISEAVPALSIIKILAVKVLLGVVSGFLLDFLYHGILKKEIRYKNIHNMCESEHCGCEESIWKSSLVHTVRIFVFILAVTFVLTAVIEGIGEERISEIVSGVPVAGEVIAGLVGLIPNCASSVVISQLYVEGVIGAGPMMTGLLANAGVGMLILFRTNKKHWKQNIGILAYVYTISVVWGLMIELFHISF